MEAYRIGEISTIIGLSVDTLRYYEKLGLLPPVARTPSGTRIYGNKDMSRLRFIQRAKMMNFSLAEIDSLLKLRDDPVEIRFDIRELTRRKLIEIDEHLGSLQTLRTELHLLLTLCNSSDEGCPIITGIEEQSETNTEESY